MDLKPADRRRQQMIDAAFCCFCENGIEMTSISDIAHKAAVGEATVYRHFATKENLALECGKKFWSMVGTFYREKTETAEFQEKSGMAQVEQMIWMARDFYRQHTDAFGMIHNLDGFLMSHRVEPEQLAGYEEAVDGMRLILCRAIDRGKADGSIRVPADTLELYYAITNGIFSLMQKEASAGCLLASDRAVEQDKKLTLFLQLLINGLKSQERKEEYES
jgi:AcrR family transcriptional regulator